MITVPIIDDDRAIFLDGYLKILGTSATSNKSKPSDSSKGTEGCSIVIFSHGSGSSRNSTRNQKISSILNKMGLSTLLIDLLTMGETDMDIRAEQMKSKIPGLILNKFNIELLTRRLISITRWLVESKSFAVKSIGYFGSSTGAAAAYLATFELAKNRNNVDHFNIGAIVSRGGRTDLVKDINILKQINVPSLFIVGSKDAPILKANTKTMSEFSPLVETKIEIIDGASHLFEEDGKIEQVAKIAGSWFLKFL